MSDKVTTVNIRTLSATVSPPPGLTLRRRLVLEGDQASLRLSGRL